MQMQFNGGGSINASGATSNISFGVFFGSINQSIIGGSGNDRFENNFSGGTTTIGTTTMTGGAGADTYYYTGFGTNIDKDIITDFAADDTIDLSGVGIFNPAAPARFIGSAAFSNVANQVRYVKSGSTTLLQVDGNGDGVADATLTISNGAFDLTETTAGSAVLRIAPEIVGTTGNDFLNSSSQSRVIRALAGDDRINEFGSSEFIDGGEGYDTVVYRFDDLTTPVTADFLTFAPSSVPMSFSDGRGGTDQLVNVEEVRLRGGSGNDRLTGSATIGTSITAGAGADTVTGGAGNDTLIGYGNFSEADGGDTINGGDGDDYIEGGRGADILNGGNGNDIVIGDGTYSTIDGGDTISGGAGDDYVEGSTGADFIDGGDGFDTVGFDLSEYVSEATATRALNLSGLRASATDQRIADGNGTVDTIRNVEAVRIYTSNLGDTIIGSATLPNTVYLFTGNNTVTGGAAGDTFAIFRGEGVDTIVGFSVANDKIDVGGYLIGSLAEIQPFIFQSGANTVISLMGDPEAPDVILRSVNASQLTAANFVFNTTRKAETEFFNPASSQSDTLFAGVGGSRLDGLLGNDTLVSGTGADRFDFTARGFGQDRIFNFTPGSDKIVLGTVGVSSFAALRPFIAQVGTDTVITFGFNGPTESITLKGVTASQLTAADFEFSTATVATIGGSAGADVLFGSTGNDTIQALAGDDMILAGSGNDTIAAGPGLDVAAFSATRAAATITRNANGTVTVQSAADGTDHAIGCGVAAVCRCYGFGRVCRSG